MNDSLFTSPEGLKFISNWEGCILHPYLDVASKWTIGVGHLIKLTDSFSLISNDQIRSLMATKDKNHPVAKISLPESEILNILSKDVVECEEAIKKNIKTELNQNQFDALVSFGFNCGTGVYKTSVSGVARALSSGNYADVPARLLEWDKATMNGVKRPVLRNRRISEGQLFTKPIAINTSFSAPSSCDPIIPWTKEDLKIVQQKLKKMGLYALNIDGVWGKGTLSGITTFANSIGIKLENPANGIPNSILNELKKK